MSHEPDKLLHSAPVKEFLQAAAGYCIVAETQDQLSRAAFISSLRHTMAKLYANMTEIPGIESLDDAELEKNVSEDDWNAIEQAARKKLGRYNEFQEVFDPRMTESDTPVVCSLSENIADIYQDIKNFLYLYYIGTEEVMHLALCECQENFRLYWGQKVANSLRQLHELEFGQEILEDETETDTASPPQRDVSKWFLSRRQKDYQEEAEE